MKLFFTLLLRIFRLIGVMAILIYIITSLDQNLFLSFLTQIILGGGYWLIITKFIHILEN